RLISSVSSGGGGAARFAQLLSVSSSRSFATSSKPNQSSPELPAVLTMYTRPGCTLCEDAVEEVQHLIDAGRIVLRRVDIDLPENERYQVWRYDIPVFKIRGLPTMMHQLDLDALTRHLNQLELAERSKTD
ncbi:hypothetical protein BOX15_Mlig027778g2, partial [Macrostomum lignano]